MPMVFLPYRSTSLQWTTSSNEQMSMHACCMRIPREMFRKCFDEHMSISSFALRWGGAEQIKTNKMESPIWDVCMYKIDWWREPRGSCFLWTTRTTINRPFRHWDEREGKKIVSKLACAETRSRIHQSNRVRDSTIVIIDEVHQHLMSFNIHFISPFG